MGTTRVRSPANVSLGTLCEPLLVHSFVIVFCVLFLYLNGSATRTISLNCGLRVSEWLRDDTNLGAFFRRFLVSSCRHVPINRFYDTIYCNNHVHDILIVIVDTSQNYLYRIQAFIGSIFWCKVYKNKLSALIHCCKL